jgi:hypothetical protein
MDIETILEMYEDDYTPSAMVPGPRNIKLAQVPRSEMDNFNTPDLEQAPDSYLKPGETLEDFDVEFRRPNAQGGRIPFAEGTPRKIYKVARPITEVDKKLNPNIPDDAKFKMQVPGGKFRGKGSSTEMIYDTNKTNLNKRLKEIESNVYVKPSKPREPIPDDKFLVKKNSTRVKENINKIEYEEVLGKKNQPNTFKPTGKTVIRYKPFIGQNKITIPGQGAKTLKEAETFVKDYFKANPKQVRVRDPEKDYASKDERRKFEKDKQGRTIKFGAKKGYVVHHMLPLAGKADVTDSDLAVISKKMNAELSQFDKPMNALVNEAYALDFSKEGSLKRMNEINKELADILKKAENKLPKKYQGLLGFNKLTPVLDEFDAKGNQVFDIKPVGIDYKKSIGGKKTGTPIRDKKTKDIVQQVMDAPTFRSNPFFDPSLMGKVISDIGKGINVGLGPTGMIALTKYLEPEGGYDLSRTGDRLGFEAEAALAKPLVSGAVSVTDKIKNPMLRKIAERAALAGMSPTMAMKVASRLSPIGIASLAGEAVYKLGELGYEDQKRFDALSPEEQK